MKKTPFIVLLVIEVFAGFLAMGLLFSDVGALIYLIAAVVFAAVLAPFLVRLKNATEEAKKAKIRRNILLVMLIPVVIAVLATAAVVIAMLAYFG